MAAPVLLPTWHMTIAEAATELGVHRDRLLRYADMGVLVPAALVPRTSMASTSLAPAPYFVVPLHDYLEMLWTDAGQGDAAAPIVGSHRVYQIDGTAHVNVEFDATIVVRRSDLVFLSDGIEALRLESQPAAEAGKRPHPAKTRTLQQILGVLIAERWPNAGPYTVAEQIVRVGQRRGVSFSKECVARHVKECLAEMNSASSGAKEDFGRAA